MSTLERLDADLTASMKARDATRTNTLRQAIGAVRAEAKAGPAVRELSEDDVLAVLAREVKKRRESAQIYADAGAAERAATETAEADLIATYLPAAPTAEELAGLVRTVVDELGAAGPKDMGRVMKEVTARAGRGADGRALSALVREELAARAS
ncbi:MULTISPECIES: GatB/YqeY domain-containing protein [Cellulomonas]|uniref:GatB/YqeY domain-containing protein n=1 Tax=Cellulomonas TaxID=1707 RepID=UPI0010A85A91|nr:MULTISPECIES: GatB/YqeY domain-containing protein [Cellulomonas]